MTTTQKILLGAILLVGVALRVYFLFNYELIDAKEHVVALSDEATVGLMAKHIASGREFPVFFYGQNYLGALEAYIAALLFGVFGASLLTLKAAPAIFSIVLLFVVYLVAKTLFNVRVAILSTALVAIPSAYFFSWTLKARGGFIEHIILSLLILFLFSLIYFERRASLRLYALLGAVSGFALWVNQLVLVYLVTLGLLLWLKRGTLLDRSKLLHLVPAFVLFAAPIIAGNIQEPLGTIKILAQKFNGGNSGPASESDLEKATGALLARLSDLPAGAGRNLAILFGKEQTWIGESEIPETTRIENLPEAGWLFAIIPFLFAPPLLASWYESLKIRLIPSAPGKSDGVGDTKKINLLVLLFSVTLLGYFSPNYLLVCYPLAAILAAAFFVRLKNAYAKALYATLLVATISFNAYGIMDLALNERDRSITKLINELEAKGCRYGYSSGPMYQVAFYSLERSILVPLDSKNRYPPYGKEAGRAPQTCYVFRPDQERKIDHRAFLMMLQRENVRYRQTTVNSDTVYHIYHSFAPREKIPPNVRETLKLIRRELRPQMLSAGTASPLSRHKHSQDES